MFEAGWKRSVALRGLCFVGQGYLFHGLGQFSDWFLYDFIDMFAKQVRNMLSHCAGQLLFTKMSLRGFVSFVRHEWAMCQVTC